MKTTSTLRTSAVSFAIAALLALATATPDEQDDTAAITLDYLEIVTPELDATCALLSRVHGVTFSDPQPALGSARTAKLSGGGQIAVRKPMHAAERSVVRPYLLVDDIDAAFEQAEAAGAQIMMPPTENETGGRFSIYMLGGIEHAIWQR